MGREPSDVCARMYGELYGCEYSTTCLCRLCVIEFEIERERQNCIRFRWNCKEKANNSKKQSLGKNVAADNRKKDWDWSCSVCFYKIFD